MRGVSNKHCLLTFFIQDQLSINAGSKYCRMLQGEHSAILLTFIKLPIVIKIFVFVYFEWPFYTGSTVMLLYLSVYEYVLLIFLMLWALTHITLASFLWDKGNQI